jgi:hypothetical protein
MGVVGLSRIVTVTKFGRDPCSSMWSGESSTPLGPLSLLRSSLLIRSDTTRSYSDRFNECRNASGLLSIACHCRSLKRGYFDELSL